MSLDAKLALNAEITAQGEQDDQTLARDYTGQPIVTAKRPNKKKYSSTTEWNVASETGTFQGEKWPSHLPRPPSRKQLLDSDSAHGAGTDSRRPGVVVFNANTQEGSSMVRVLSDKGMRVTAVVRVFTSRNTKNLIKLKNVTVKVADLNNADAVQAAAAGCQQAFLVTNYWERFENSIEEHMAQVVLTASAASGIRRLVLATFEDTWELRRKGRKSQLMPTVDGRVFPKFDGMQGIDGLASELGVQVTHMFTSYLEEEDSKKSLILIRGENGKIMCQPYIQERKN